MAWSHTPHTPSWACHHQHTQPAIYQNDSRGSTHPELTFTDTAALALAIHRYVHIHNYITCCSQNTCSYQAHKPHASHSMTSRKWDSKPNGRITVSRIKNRGTEGMPHLVSWLDQGACVDCLWQVLPRPHEGVVFHDSCTHHATQRQSYHVTTSHQQFPSRHRHTCAHSYVCMCTAHYSIAGICPSQHTNEIPSWHARTITAFSIILMTYAAY